MNPLLKSFIAAAGMFLGGTTLGWLFVLAFHNKPENGIYLVVGIGFSLIWGWAYAVTKIRARSK